MELSLRETKELGDVESLEGKQTVIASYWSVSNSHIKKSSRDVREWKVTQDLMLCPSAVVVGSFIKTSMTCSHTGGMEGAHSLTQLKTGLKPNLKTMSILIPPTPAANKSDEQHREPSEQDSFNHLLYKVLR